VLSSTPQHELAVYPLTERGTLAGLPRYFRLGGPTFVRYDFKARKLYALANEWMRVWSLDADGYPAGQSTLHALRCGVVRDALLDENTGKLYVACTEPPAAAR